jgi:hypothetical protein
MDFNLVITNTATINRTLFNTHHPIRMTELTEELINIWNKNSHMLSIRPHEVDKFLDIVRMQTGCGKSINANGDQQWWKKRKLHRDGDLPAFIGADGTQKWYQNGKLHRDGDLPAVIWASGNKEWYQNGKRHRDGDLPAFVWASGPQVWFQRGEIHRDGDLPAVVWADGTQEWYQNGKRHRKGNGDLPAKIFADGTQQWYQNGELHRDGDLPAIIWANGNKEWRQNGKLHRENDLPAIIDVYNPWWKVQDPDRERNSSKLRVMRNSSNLREEHEWWNKGFRLSYPLVRKHLQTRIKNENARKVVLMHVFVDGVGTNQSIPRDIGMVISNYC